MDARLLHYYNRELAYLRELGAEFAQLHPKVAGRLGLGEGESADPYVERLLEGFCFLTARIQLKMDAEFPRFSQRMLDVVYPGYLAPTPSMAIVAFEPNVREGNLRAGFTLPAGTAVQAKPDSERQTACEFRTAHAVTLWPLRLNAASFAGEPGDLPLAALGLARRVRGCLRLRLETQGSMPLRELSLERLALHLSGPDREASRLLEWLMCRTVAVVCHDPERPLRWHHLLGADALRHDGFEADEALLPTGPRGFQGYRVLQEYFAMPARGLFLSLHGLGAAVQRAQGRTMEISLLFDAADPELEASVGSHSLALHCTPIVNLQRKLSDRIPVSTQRYEHHLVPDRTKPLDYEVYSVEKVVGHGARSGEKWQFHPFYSCLRDGSEQGRFFSLRREPRIAGAPSQAVQPRSRYAGSEVFLSLVDAQEAPHADELRQLSVEMWCSNRDLPMRLRPAEHGLGLRVSAPVASIRLLHGPTPPRPALAEGEAAWRLISHLGLNHLTLTDLDEVQGAQALRELLELYAGRPGSALHRQIQGLRSARLEPVHRPMPALGPIVLARGVRIEIGLDETAFSGASPYLLGSVLEQFLARHVALNSFIELALHSLQRGPLHQWPPRLGRRPVA
ncbi:type VI secretion system baseplate subunit TssF [Lysobacter sp. BMK333-48F3]|uniref:type VI secretion system baseplate subunit TssF n=1 Tax=Lysobacter sp. BMK333-48F3 TaxID=2867962 RepID=UPI001C8B73CB|nr:type VI secretion system baseplate subunit TssF [Lysobacter sp. BMK333-48F3]MBX9403041.1 type VI secretion system baseplate subunit TssF [Lysobacter sp. BMK333-48F3]